jgi:hypothetical protein
MQLVINPRGHAAAIMQLHSIDIQLPEAAADHHACILLITLTCVSNPQQLLIYFFKMISRLITWS